jgi:hypothetical protein
MTAERVSSSTELHVFNVAVRKDHTIEGMTLRWQKEYIPVSRRIKNQNRKIPPKGHPHPNNLCRPSINSGTLATSRFDDTNRLLLIAVGQLGIASL